MNNIWLPFITGLTSGGLSCFAVQGGLLTSALSQLGIDDVRFKKEKSILVFLISKLASYTILGALLGTLGSIFVLSTKFQGFLQIFVGFYLLATAGRLLEIHPIFRYFVIQPPKSVFKFMRKFTNSDSPSIYFSSIILGALTILIPCGVTQAMMLLAISSGSAFYGASIMFFFVLGTSPIFFLIGLAATTLLKNKAFTIVAALFVFILGVSTINSGQLLRGSVHTFQNYWKVLTTNPAVSGNLAKIQNGKQIVNITVTNNKYISDTDTLKLGIPVTLNLTTNNVVSCSRTFTIPAYNINKVLPETGTTTIEFTPDKPGLLTYTCSMGMYSGSFNVVE